MTSVAEARPETGESVRELPWVEPAQAGVWVASTHSGTRYVLVVPPEGPAAAARIAFYGYDRGFWSPLHSAHAVDGAQQPRPMRVGESAVVRFTPNRGDFYYSTRVASITAYGADALSSLQEVVAEAEAGFAADLVLLIVSAARTQGLSREEVRQLCQETGADLDSVRKHLSLHLSP